MQVLGCGILIAALVALGSPARAQLVRRAYAEVHMGVPVRLVLYAPHDSVARQAARAAYARIAELDDVLSDWRSSSELSRLGDEGDPVRALSAPLCAVLGRALRLAEESGGAFDPTVGPLIELWRAARRSGRPPSVAALDSARARVGWRRVALDRTSCRARIEPGTRLDLGGIAKGYVLDEALGVLRAHGVTRALLEAGGDIVAGEAPPGRRGWRVEAPEAGWAIRCPAAALANAALAISGDAEQRLEIDGVRYSHVVDARTGVGLTSGATAWVIAPDGLTADGLATALTVLDAAGRRALLRRYGRVRAEVREPASDRRGGSR